MYIEIKENHKIRNQRNYNYLALIKVEIVILIFIKKKKKKKKKCAVHSFLEKKREGQQGLKERK